MKTTKNLIIIFILTMTYLVGYGQEDKAPLSEEQQAAKLAKATQNPLAAMYSLPFQNNTTFGMGEENDQSLNVLNIQPVIPVSINENINLINRVSQISRSGTPFIGTRHFGISLVKGIKRLPNPAAKSIVLILIFFRLREKKINTLIKYLL